MLTNVGCDCRVRQAVANGLTARQLVWIPGNHVVGAVWGNWGLHP